MKENDKGRDEIDPFSTIYLQLLSHCSNTCKFTFLSELLRAGIRLSSNRLLYTAIHRLHNTRDSGLNTHNYRLRPKPIAASIFLSVSLAIALAFTAPWSKYSSSSGESINS